jgi:hypothetical protein
VLHVFWQLTNSLFSMKATKTLKSLSLLLAGLFTAGYASAQCTTYDFSSSAGWTQVNTGVAISGAQVTFTGAADGSVPRFVHTTFTPALSNTSWYCDFDFTPVSGTGPAHTLIAFTPSAPAVYNASGNYSPPPIKYSNMHCIEVAIQGAAGNTNPDDWWIYARAKQFNSSFAAGYTLTSSPAWSSSGNIDLPAGSANVKRYVRIQRIDATNCKLSMYSDASRTVLMGSTCFTIPSAIGGLDAVQVGNKPEGSSTRTFYGNVDNISFCNLNPSLTGPSSICSNVSGLYKLSNGNSSVTADCGFPGSVGFTWSAPAGSSLGNGTGGTCFTSGTGNGSQNGISVGASGVITCIVDYGCATVTYTRNVTSLQTPTSSFTNTSPYCSNESILVNGTASTNETSHQWSLAPCTSAGVLTGSWNNAASVNGTAGNANLTSLLPAFFPCPAYYKIRLVTNNSCGSAMSEQVIMVSCLPNVTAGTNTSLCPGGCTGLTSSGATTYSWSPAAGLSSTTVSNPTACPASTTVYTVTGSAPGCPSDAASVTLTVSTLSVDAGLDHSMCCNGLYTMAPVVSGGTAPYTYNWSPATGLTCSHGGTHSATSCPAPWVRHCTSINYTLSVTDAAGCTVTDQILVSTFPCRLGNDGNETDAHTLSVFPNPASNEINVNSRNEVAGMIELTDLTGRVVMQTKPQTNLVVLNVAELPEGAYLIRVTTSAGIQTQEVIISH